MAAIDFGKIRTAPTGPRDAFEDLACILFRKTACVAMNSEYVRVRGSGGDGGVEAILIEPTGVKFGIQAKYFFKLGTSELGQIKASFQTAIINHPELAEFHVYIPFDLTNVVAGGRRGTSERKKFDDWKAEVEYERLELGSPIKVVLCSAADVNQKILELDTDGGLRRYWFDVDTLTEDVIRRGLSISEAKAGPRFTSALDVVTDAYKMLDIFGGTADIYDLLDSDYVPLVREFIRELPGKTESPYACLVEEEATLLKGLGDLADMFEAVHFRPSDLSLAATATSAIGRVLPLLRLAESVQLKKLQDAHGENADNVRFRQFQAEHMVAFPAGDLDSTRNTIRLLKQLSVFLESAMFRVAGANTLLMVGPAGIGKTHSLVSAAKRRLKVHALSAVLFGDDFASEEPWRTIAGQLGFGAGIGRDELYGVMQAAAEHTGFPFLVVIDALNESPNLQKWKTLLRGLIAEMRPFSGIRLIVSTRDTYRSLVVDTEFPGFAFENTGFVGKEIQALQAFCEYFGITSEITPIFADELTNPLFLQLACKTFRESDAQRLDLSLPGFVSLIESYFGICDKELRTKLGYANPKNLVRSALTCIVDLCQEEHSPSLTWEAANTAIRPTLDNEVKSQEFLEGLRQAGLLIIVPSSNESVEEYVVRIGFQRFSDVLLALAIAERSATSGTLSGEALSSAINKFGDADMGVLEAIACVLPDRFGVELPNIETKFTEPQLLEAFVNSLPWRSRDGLTAETERYVLAALINVPDLWKLVYPALFKISLIPNHQLNANYLQKFFVQDSLTQRDPYLSLFARESFVGKGVIYSLLKCAQSADIGRFPDASLDLLATVLAWLTSASDRRVRDRSIKGLTRLIYYKPALAQPLLDRMKNCRDGYIFEGLTTAVYGARLLSRGSDSDGAFLSALDTLIQPEYDTPDIVVRDCVRLLAKSLPLDSDGKLALAVATYPRPVALPSNWPVLKDLEEFLSNVEIPPNLKMRPTGMYADFSQYQVRSLVEQFDLKAAGISYENILSWFMLELVKLGYARTQNVIAHDHMLLREFGDGRGKPAYAETLGKKYYWIALHRLVGMLQDNVPPAKNYDGSPKKIAYDSQDVRKLDPTDLRAFGLERDYDWALLGDSRYPFEVQPEDDSVWVKRSGDVTPMAECVVRRDDLGTEWILLNFYAANREEAEGIRTSKEGYRRVVCSIASIFTDRNESCLSEKESDTLSRAFQSQGTEYKGFLAEYPRSDFYVTREATGEFSSTYSTYDKPVRTYGLSTLRLLRGSEWEYDSSSDEDISSLSVPAPDIVKACNLSWDGHSGWLNAEGQLVGLSLEDSSRFGFFLRRDTLDNYLNLTNNAMYFQQCIFRSRINGFSGGGHQSDTWEYASYDGDLKFLFKELKFYPD